MTFSGEFLAFMSLALVAVIGGVLLLNLTKVVHMVVALVFTFVSIAGIYVLLSAEFLVSCPGTDLLRGDYNHHAVRNHADTS